MNSTYKKYIDFLVKKERNNRFVLGVEVKVDPIVHTGVVSETSKVVSE